MTEIPVGYMSRGFVEGRAREAALVGSVAITRTAKARSVLAERRRLAPTQEHPRQCRCDRPLFDQDSECAKCGLPLVWHPVTLEDRAAIAAFVASERENAYRKRRRERKAAS